MSRIMRVSDEFFNEVKRLKEKFKKDIPGVSDVQITNVIAFRLKTKMKKKTLAEILFG